ncbi:MAG: glyoxylate/hydroxypyruvate reductase A [Marivirga sp.]|jgi:glyoxylate/hydroxypyruvate reductase A
MIRKILTGGLHSKDFQLFLQRNYPEINCIIAKSTTETMNLIHEVDSIAGFNFIPTTDLSHIKWIHSFGAGIDSFLQHRLASELLLTKTTGGMGQRIAEYCLSHILFQLQELRIFQQQQEKKRWQQIHLPELKDTTIYIFGTGFVGESIASLLSPITKKVIGINTSGKNRPYFAECFPLLQSNKIQFEERAVVINALPLTKQTKRVMDSGLFNQMKEVLLINIGRGGTINQEDLLKSLANRQIKQAVLDVFTTEPLPESSILWDHPNIIVTPHISGITNFSDIQSSFSLIYEAIKNKKEIPNQINLAMQY